VQGCIINWHVCRCVFGCSHRLGKVGSGASEGGVNFKWWVFVEVAEIRRVVAVGDIVESGGGDFAEGHGERTSNANHFSQHG
jgi:hypothetical protein